MKPAPGRRDLRFAVSSPIRHEQRGQVFAQEHKRTSRIGRNSNARPPGRSFDSLTTPPSPELGGWTYLRSRQCRCCSPYFLAVSVPWKDTWAVSCPPRSSSCEGSTSCGVLSHQRRGNLKETHFITLITASHR